MQCFYIMAAILLVLGIQTVSIGAMLQPLNYMSLSKDKERGKKGGKEEEKEGVQADLLLNSCLKFHWAFLMNTGALASLTSRGASVGRRHATLPIIRAHRQVQSGTSWHLIWAPSKSGWITPWLWALKKQKDQKLLDIKDSGLGPEAGY